MGNGKSSALARQTGFYRELENQAHRADRSLILNSADFTCPGSHWGRARTLGAYHVACKGGGLYPAPSIASSLRYLGSPAGHLPPKAAPPTEKRGDPPIQPGIEGPDSMLSRAP